MNSIDERIKRELEAESMDVDKIMGETGDLNEMFRAALKGSTGPQLKFVLVVTTLAFLGLVGCVWQFWTAPDISSQIFWGVWSALVGITMIGGEIWAWMEINRASTMRAISGLELAIRGKGASLTED